MWNVTHRAAAGARFTAIDCGGNDARDSLQPWFTSAYRVQGHDLAQWRKNALLRLHRSNGLADTGQNGQRSSFVDNIGQDASSDHKSGGVNTGIEGLCSQATSSVPLGRQKCHQPQTPTQQTFPAENETTSPRRLTALRRCSQFRCQQSSAIRMGYNLVPRPPETNGYR